MIIREDLMKIGDETYPIFYPIQWRSFHKPHWIKLDLEVMYYYLYFHNGKIMRLYRYGKSETVENDLSRNWNWRQTLPKAESFP